MNLGQAVAVCLYELVRGGEKIPRQDKQGLAAAGELERITARLLEILCASGYLKPHPTAGTQEKIRRMVRRLNMPAADAEIWLGVLRQILWKLQLCK